MAACHCRKLNPASKRSRIGRCSWLMRDVCSLIWLALIGLFRSRASLQAEILTLRHQLNVLRRKSPQRPTFSGSDRLVFAGLYRLASGMPASLAIVKPETVIRWHRAGFRAYWRWKSRLRGGRPKTPLEVRQLIREMSLANPLWGAPRIHGELLKLGIDVGRPASPSTWSGHGDLRLKVGRPFSEMMRTALPRWTRLWRRPFRSGCYTA